MTGASDQDVKSTRATLAAMFNLLIGHVTGLVRKEVDLARAELSEKINQAAVAIGLIVGAVVFLLVALNVLSAAIVAGLAELGMAPGWASFAVGAVYFVIAAAMIRKGTKDLKATSLAPRRTAQTVRRDVNALKEKLHG